MTTRLKAFRTYPIGQYLIPKKDPPLLTDKTWPVTFKMELKMEFSQTFKNTFQTKVCEKGPSILSLSFPLN